MRKIKALSWTTFQELLREKFFVVGIVVALILVTLSYLLGSLSFDEATRILFNLGTLAIEVVTIGLGVFAGSRLVSKEIELRTCQIILTRPISRVQFLIGKWMGLFLFILSVLTGLSILVLILGGSKFLAWDFLWIVLEIGLKASVVMTVVFLSSLFLRPVLAAIIGICIYFLGHSVEDIRFFLKKSSPDGEIPPIMGVIEKVVPRFDLFNWKSYYFIENALSHKQVALMFSHYIAWTLFLLVVGLISWRKKDIG
jgi:ABC-type transport system involved in multi-copper enzyme maturation permease subunit